MWDSNFVRRIYKTERKTLETLIVKDSNENYDKPQISKFY